MFNNQPVGSTSTFLANRRERMLGIVLVAVIATGVVYRSFGSDWSWSSDESLMLGRLSSEYERLRQEIDRQESMTLTTLARQAASLPADGVLAATRYYAWLHELAGQHGLTEIKIDNTAPIVDPAFGHRIQFALQARANVRAMGTFLDHLQSYDLLHSITHLQLQDYSPLSGEVRIQLNLEALSLKDAKQSDLPMLSQSEINGPLTSYFAEHNPFRRYEPPKPTVTATVAALPVVDPLSKVTFVGVVQRGGVKQAWFFDALNHQEMLLSVGSQVTVGTFQSTLESLGESTAVLANAEGHWSINLGQNLRSILGTSE